MKIYVDRVIARDMIIQFMQKVAGTSFKLVELKPIDVYAFVLTDTYLHIEEQLHDVNVALDRAIERADRLAVDNFKAFVEENKEAVMNW